MKKLSVIFIIGLLLVGIIISCDNKVNDNINETVSISFNNLSSRAISSSVENFDAKKLYWKYSAKKNSADNNPNLNSGATSSNYATDEAGAVAIGQGLNATLSGFSQGLWDFKLFAYKDEGYSKLAYGGEATGVRLEWGKDNVVNVEVSPYSDQGPGTIDLSGLTVKCNETVIDNWSIISVSYNSEPASEASGKELTVSPGTYSITITIKNLDDSSIEYDPLTLDQEITVYSNLTTSVTGEVSVGAYNKIGGVIFYIAEAAVGDTAIYTFYSEEKVELLSGNTFFVGELLDAVYYKVSGKAEDAADRFFVLNTNDYLFNSENKVYWGSYGKNLFPLHDGNTPGKTITAEYVNYINNQDDDTVNNNYRNCGTEGTYMFDWVISFNTDNTNTINTTGLCDWYIPSFTEMLNLKNNYSNISGKLQFLNLDKMYKTSTALDFDVYCAFDWTDTPFELSKDFTGENCVIIRSF